MRKTGTEVQSLPPCDGCEELGQYSSLALHASAYVMFLGCSSFKEANLTNGVVWGGIGVGTASLLHHCHQCFKIHNPQRRALTELKPTKVSFLVCLPCKEKCELRSVGGRMAGSVSSCVMDHTENPSST
ncbi:unnamed protein product [Arctogadus glacialis]